MDNDGRITMTKRPRLKINLKILNLLERALDSAKMENCGVDEATKRKMKLYLDTWVVSPLDKAIAKIEGRDRP